MANKPLNLNPGRQYPLVAEQAFDFTHVADSGVPVKILRLPRGATILSGTLSVTTAFGGALALGPAGTPAMYGSLAGAVGNVALTPTFKANEASELFLTPAAASTAGKGVLRVTYVITDRANEVQP